MAEKDTKLTDNEKLVAAIHLVAMRLADIAETIQARP
jgi:hypothetical protein